MNNTLKSMLCAFLLGGFSVPSVGVAQTEDFNVWKEQFYQLALHSGIQKQTLDKYVPKMELLPQVVEQDRKLPEYLRNFWDYTASRLTPAKIEQAKNMKAMYKTWLNRVSTQYHVPEQYLLALWSMETNFGSFMGKTPLLKSLSSLAYDARRRKFFTQELLAYFKILETEPYPPMYGSWDGGIGNFQFMPTTYVAYAVDADGNGTKSLVGSIPDSLASAANYLHQMGWHENETWGRPVILPEDFNWENAGQTKLVSEWKKMGFMLVNGQEIPTEEEEIKATLHTPMGSQGPVFLTYPNFKLINRWNKLELYALTTGMLADIIAQNPNQLLPPSDFRPLKTETFRQLQEKLSELGYYSREIDGKLGSGMRQALKAYQKDNHLKTDGYPNKEVLMKLDIYNEELK